MKDPQNSMQPSRRFLLQRSACGFGLMGLASLLGRGRLAAAGVDPLAPKQPHFPAKAKRVIFLLAPLPLSMLNSLVIT